MSVPDEVYTSYPASGLPPAAEAVQLRVAPVDVTALAVNAPGVDGLAALLGALPQTSVLPEYSGMSPTVTGVALVVVGMPWNDQSSAGLCAAGKVSRNCTCA